MVAIDMLEFLEKGYKGYCLNGLSKSHFISQDTINSSFIESNEPVKTIELIVSELTTLEYGRLSLQSSEYLIIIDVSFIIIESWFLLMALGNWGFSAIILFLILKCSFD